MAGLFAKLRATVDAGEPATPATVATPSPALPLRTSESSRCSGSSSASDSEGERHVEPEPETAESDHIEALAEALTEKAGAFMGDGIEQAEADHLAVVVVQCRTCTHYRRSRNKPEASAGICTEGAWPLSWSAHAAQRHGMPSHPPRSPRLCESWRGTE